LGVVFHYFYPVQSFRKTLLLYLNGLSSELTLLIYSIKSQSYILFSQLSDIVILFLFLLVLVNDFQYTAGDIVIHTFKVHRITYFVHLDHPLLAVKVCRFDRPRFLQVEASQMSVVWTKSL
jgi:hypothetical protein